MERNLSRTTDYRISGKVDTKGGSHNTWYLVESEDGSLAVEDTANGEGVLSFSEDDYNSGLVGEYADRARRELGMHSMSVIKTMVDSVIIDL